MRSRSLVTAVAAATLTGLGGPAAAGAAPSGVAGHRGQAAAAPALAPAAVSAAPAVVRAAAPAAAGRLPRAVRPRLADPHPCPEQPGFTCSTLTVPLDHRGRVPGTLALQVATGDNAHAPKGVLLFLTGGPGQPGVQYITRIVQQRLPELAKNYRFVMLDQRGTGATGGIDCPMLQAQVGSSDIAAPTPEAIRQCSDILGPRRGLYSTEQTVADYEALREALGVPAMVVDGVSYGSFTAARYAAAYPAHVRKVVLDSVLPHVDPEGDDGLYLAGLHAQARVLRDACKSAPACPYDPAGDLAWVVRHRGDADGVKIFDAIVSYEFADPTYRDPNPPGLPKGHGDVIGALHAARQGDPSRLATILKDFAPGGDPVELYSAGLHIDAFCSDARFPWGRSDAPLATRPARLEEYLRHVDPRRAWPYTTATSAGNGFVQECLRWQSRPAAEPPARLPDVPVLVVNGDHDLSTPLEWAYEEATHARHAKVVVVKGASHSVQNRERGHAGRDAVIAFLNR